jgi:RNA ligase
MTDKPLGRKAYGHIPHLPGSRMGPGDHTCEVGQARIATLRARDRHDVITVQEKLDGSCTAVAKINGEIIALSRAGYRAITSPYRQHALFHLWVMANWARFNALLAEGERAVGEWLAQAHGTRYDLTDRDPWVVFDLMVDTRRALESEVTQRATDHGFAVPPLLTNGPTSIETAMGLLGPFGYYGALDQVEGVVWRVERKGEVDFLVKYVRPDKIDGLYLESITGTDPIWNWQP